MDDTINRKRKWAQRKSRMAKRRAWQVPADPAETVQEWMQRPSGLPLLTYAAKFYSQHGEDGITVEVFRRIGIEHRRAVEIGGGQNGGNAGILVSGLCFNALLIDGDKKLVTLCRSHHPGATVRWSWVNRETIDKLITKSGYGDDLDYLGIDLDGVDYWIWEALSVRPRLLVVEYNQFFGSEESVTIAYTPDFSRRERDENGRHRVPKAYWGASLAAFDKLGRARGYRLIGTAPNSANAYFLREDLGCDIPTVPVAEAWTEPTKGYKRWLRPYTKAQEAGLLRYFDRQGFPLAEV